MQLGIINARRICNEHVKKAIKVIVKWVIGIRFTIKCILAKTLALRFKMKDLSLLIDKKAAFHPS